MKVSITKGSESLSLLGELSTVSQLAFSRPPFHLADDHASRLNQFLQHPASYLYLPELPLIRAFAIGTVLRAEDMIAFSLNVCPEVSEGDYHLTWRAVAPEAQGAGLGSLLMTFRIEHARELGCRSVHGDTDSMNLSTRRLFSRLGFQLKTRVPILRNGKVSFRVFYSLRL